MSKNEKHSRNIVRVDSISTIYEWYGLGKPENPLIALIDYSKMKSSKSLKGFTFVLGLYVISMKKVTEMNAIQYGRRHYDFQEGTLMFMTPEQTITIETEENPLTGWGLYFHPDLIRKSNLGKNIKNYTFFSYDVHEALHISGKEKKILKTITKTIKDEYSTNLDNHSHTLIISSLELLLNYCDRFYTRQFLTRKSNNLDVISKFEKFLKEYFESNKPKINGLPSVKECAYQMNYSTNYLSDLLKKETGKTTLEHIHYYIIDLAKTILLSSNDSVQEISYQLGFEYAQQFSRLFKKETGMSPVEYRSMS